MRILIDTHILLWWMTDDIKLSREGKFLITEPKNTIFYSAATVWEIRIKEKLGKISLPKLFTKALEGESFEKLPISVEHAHAINTLPDIHRDPFDRILIAQAALENLTLVTHDAILKKYPVAKILLV